MELDTESKEILKSILTLAERNNRLLQKVRRVQKREAAFRFLKYFIIVAVVLGSFYFLEPYIEQVKGLYDSAMGIQRDLSGSPFRDLLK